MSADQTPAEPGTQELSPADRALLDRLRAVVGAVDPVPADVAEHSRELFALRQLDEELAELVPGDPALAGVRGADASDVLLLSFQASAVGVEVQVSPTPPSRLVLGQVDPAGVGAVRLDSVNGGDTRVASLDELGMFRFEGVRPGLVRVSVPAASGGRVCTAWFRA